MAEVQHQIGFLQAESIGLGVAPLLEHLVANAPDEDGGMVAVAHDEVGEVTFVPLVEVAGIVVGRLLLAPHVKGFIHDDEAHAVAQVEQFGGRRVVRAADAVAPHLLQYLQLPLDGTRVDRRTQATQVVVHAHAVYLDVLPVKEETLLGIELEGADAEGRVVDIGHLAAGKHRGAHIVQVGMFDAPKHGVVKGKFLPGLCLCLRLYLEGCGRSLCHDAPFGIDQLGAKHQGGRRRLAIVHGGAHRQAGMVLGHFIGGDVSAPLPHVHGAELAQPHVAVDAASGVPARVGLLGIVHPHGQHVFGSPLQVGRQVVAERDVSVGARAQRMAVDVDGAVHVHAIKVYVEAFALVRLVHGKGFAVPAHASGQRASASARRIVFRKIALDGPIVRQVQLPPLRVVVGGLRGIGNIAKPECPAGGKVLPAAIALFFPGRHGGTRTCQQKYGQDR